MASPRTVVITGAAGGIGRTYAERFAAAGDAVVVVDIADGEETVAAVRAAGGDALWIACDLTDPGSVTSLAAEVEERFGGCDVLVNNAVAYATGLLEELTFEQWRNVIGVGLDGPFLMCQAFVPGMRERGWGRVINISSNTIGMKIDNRIPYLSAKMGVIGLTRALASEVGADGITVNAVAPGLVRTDKTWAFLGESGFFDVMAARQAIHRTETPDDLAGTLLFLASDDAAFITGQTIVVDGGLVRH
ncbi:MAG TPA: SDR family oxidoreductase [Solirubrobacteraceae bacterium]|nr:SDR family oxidoreductase [Solirubrobacteraceae bacterium]